MTAGKDSFRRHVMHHSPDLEQGQTSVSNLFTDADVLAFFKRVSESADRTRSLGLGDPEFVELYNPELVERLRTLHKSGKTMLYFMGENPKDPTIFADSKMRPQLASDTGEAFYNTEELEEEQ